ncbi:response regulator transcription factor [Thalassococcus lentus]|uniref:Response regulator transcription factor n=1 Tax=Thalassococcus lentus TaxID=1210524 RepID=A0ABT4XRZ6_9RHOB|nr:response regulator transcription factor [Thalassococcus lentus]MDA7424731.1 response regulator transcription factor [Thalassococcus lentus]
MPRSLMLIDDHHMVLDGLRRYLASIDDVDILAVSSVDEALDSMRAKGPFDLILADLHMPDAHGFDWLAQIAMANRQNPVAVLSGSTSYHDVVVAQSVGACCFIRKNTPARRIVELTEMLLDNPDQIPDEIKMENLSDIPPTLAGRLSAEQCETLVMVAQGMSNAEISNRMGVTVSRVSEQLRSIYKKLGVKSRMQASALLMEASV